MIKDPIVEEVRRIRADIERKAGGFEGLVALYLHKQVKRKARHNRRVSPRKAAATSRSP